MDTSTRATAPARVSFVPLPTDRLWTLAECALYLQMSTSWVRRSDVPVVELGRARRYDPDQVRLYKERHLSHHIVEPAVRKSA